MRSFPPLPTSLLLAGLLLNTAAHAEHWVEVTSSQDGAVKQFVDMDSIERYPGLVTLSRLFSFDASRHPAVNGKHPASQRVNTEIECVARAIRDVEASAYSEPMGQGDKLHEIPLPSDWAIDPQDEFVRPLWQIACGQ